MDLEYFSLKENPFKLAIDPAYLYLSRHHEEAIAHLHYAVTEGEGFITITGVRGVGKTLVCRSFIENLGESVKFAYIGGFVNDADMFLKAINAQFGIRCNTESIKEMTDALNSFLIDSKLKGRRVAVFIDDAHKLKTDVLEQVRLTSNLETNLDKLLQIVLIGEPRLNEKLDSQELRQMGQRISVGYHIKPFSYDETAAYIRHRLSIVSIGPPIRFDKTAVKHIFKYSGGIPRWINIACERALMIAYAWKQKSVSTEIAKQAVIYLTGHSGRFVSGNRWRNAIGWTAAICCLFFMLIGTIYFFRPVNENTAYIENKTEKTDAIPILSIEQPEMPAPASNINTKVPNVNNLKTSTKDADTLQVNSTTEPNTSSDMMYTVQVGAFRELKYARQRAEWLKAKGYSSKIITFSDPNGGTWHTVRFGDHFTLEQAREQAEIFSLKEKMETIVRPYREF